MQFPIDYLICKPIQIAIRWATEPFSGDTIFAARKWVFKAMVSWNPFQNPAHTHVRSLCGRMSIEHNKLISGVHHENLIVASIYINRNGSAPCGWIIRYAAQI